MKLATMKYIYIIEAIYKINKDNVFIKNITYDIDYKNNLINIILPYKKLNSEEYIKFSIKTFDYKDNIIYDVILEEIFYSVFNPIDGKRYIPKYQWILAKSRINNLTKIKYNTDDIEIKSMLSGDKSYTYDKYLNSYITNIELNKSIFQNVENDLWDRNRDVIYEFLYYIISLNVFVNSIIN
jgi:hypothetical protein